MFFKLIKMHLLVSELYLTVSIIFSVDFAVTLAISCLSLTLNAHIQSQTNQCKIILGGIPLILNLI